MTPQEIEKARLIIDALNSVEHFYHEVKEDDKFTRTLLVSTFEGEDRKKLKSELLKLLVS